MAGPAPVVFLHLLAYALLSASAVALERAGDQTALPTVGTDPVFVGPQARYVVTVEAAGARSAVPADFDGDGDLDIVSVSSNDNSVAWYERLPDGSYGPKKMISRASNGARIVTVGDINQDNKTDVVVASYYDHTVGWFENLDGKFGSMNMISRTALSAQGVSVADIDSDGDLDVLSASSGDHTIAWYENIGDGKFCEVKKVVDTNAIGVRTVIAADLDEDGFVDLAAASKDDNTIAWYRNAGDNTFQKIVIDNQARGAYSLVATDVDGDGHTDLVTAANMDGYLADNGEGGLVSFYRNGFHTSSGDLCNFTRITVTEGNTTGRNDFDWFVLSVWAGDLDMDGDIDIASASFSLLHEGGISWYENVDGNGSTWLRHKIYTTPYSKTGHYVVGADLDGDGDSDLIAVTNGDNKVQILTASTQCDNSTAAPLEKCCVGASKYWDGTSCVTCELGTFVDRTPGQVPSCALCSRNCPRLGLAFLPATCHSIPACADSAAAVQRCDCGQDRYLDAVTNICVSCPRGQITLGDRPRAPSDHVVVELSFLDQTKYRISDLSWQGFNGSRCQVPECLSGHAFDESSNTCVPCTAGTYSPGGSVVACSTCPAGSACLPSTVVPAPCQAGNFSAAGSAACSVSPAGSITAAAGMVAPEACPPGSIAAAAGMRECQLCPIGRFSASEGRSECDACGLGRASPELWTTMRPVERGDAVVWVYAEGARFVTMTAGAGNVSEAAGCTCEVGARRLATGECLPCEEGLACLGGEAIPQALPGYHAGTIETYPSEAFAGVDGEYSVFKCIRQDWCPGGPINACAEGREGVACAKCQDTMVPGDRGGCKPCKGVDELPFVLFVVVMVAGVALLHYFINKEGGRSYLLITVTSSLLVSTLQQAGILNAFALEWKEPIRSILDVVSLLNFSLDILAFDCISTLSPLMSYSLKVVFVYAVLITAASIHIGVVTLWYRRDFRSRRHVLVSMVGTICLAFLIAIVNVAAAPFQCVKSPNGLRVVYQHPTVICGESEDHLSMILMGVVAGIIPVGFMAQCIYVMKQFPQRMSRGDASFMKSYAFLVLRYKASCYWYAIVFILRNSLIGVVPLLPDLVAQCVVMQLVLLSAGGVQIHVFPWRYLVGNLADTTTSICMLVLLGLIGFISAYTAVETVTYLASVLLISALVLSLFAGIFGLAWTVRQRVYPRKEFQFFICHHKLAAAAQARYMKVLMHSLDNRANIFIDSDNLQHLDFLFDTVQTKVQHLVVYLTRDTLTRPWCAGEIATAWQHGILTTAVRCPCYVPPTEDNLANLCELMDLSSANLLQYGISYETVEKSYRALASSNSGLVLDTSIVGVAKFEALAGTLTGKGSSSKWIPQPSKDSEPLRQDSGNQQGAVVVSSDLVDDEAMAAAGMLVAKMRVNIFDNTGKSILIIGDNVEDDSDEGTQSFVGTCSALVAMLSIGSMTSLPQLRALTVCSDADRAIVLVKTPSFVFPSEEYYSAVLPKIWLGEATAAETSIRGCFKQIAINLSTHAADSILELQAGTIADRCRGRRMSQGVSIAQQASISLPPPRTGEGAAKMQSDLKSGQEELEAQISRM